MKTDNIGYVPSATGIDLVLSDPHCTARKGTREAGDLIKRGRERDEEMERWIFSDGI